MVLIHSYYLDYYVIFNHRGEQFRIKIISCMANIIKILYLILLNKILQYNFPYAVMQQFQHFIQ